MGANDHDGSGTPAIFVSSVLRFDTAFVVDAALALLLLLLLARL